MQLIAFCVSFAIGSTSLCLYLSRVHHVKWLSSMPLAVFTVLAFDALVGQISSIIVIAASPLALSALNVVFAVAIFAALRARIGVVAIALKMPMRLSRDDLFAVISYVAIAVFVIVVSVIQFGTSLEINFSSTDPAAHMYESQEVFETGKLSGMFFTHYMTALWIQMLSEFIEPIFYYKAFIISELFLYLFGSWLVYSAINRLAGKGDHALIALTVALLCIAGYPLNNLVFGFSYLGSGASFLIAAFAITLFYEGKPPVFALVMQALFLYGVFISYWIFAPIALLFVALSIIYDFRKHFWGRRKVFIPVFCGAALLLLIALCWAVAAGAISHLSTKGYSYNDFIGSFIPLIPLVVFGFVLVVSERFSSCAKPVIFLLVCLMAVVLFFTLYCMGRLSAYYYFKLYFVLWPAAFFMLACAFGVAKKDITPLLKSYLCVWLSLLVFSVAGFDSELAKRRPDIDPAAKSEALFGVYLFNLQELRSSTISQDEVALWKEADRLSELTGSYIPMLGSNISVYWYEGVTHHRSEYGFRYYQYWLYDEDERSSLLIDRLKEAPYVIVITDAELPDDVVSYVSSHAVVFSNPAGAIYDLGVEIF